VASNLDLKVEQAQQILETFDPLQRLKKLADLLAKEIEVLEMQHKIQTQAREEMDKTHREYYLREQLKAIQKELGETDERSQEIQELEQKIEKAKMPAEVLQEAKTQLAACRGCTRTRPRPRSSGPTWTGSSTCPGCARRRTS